MSAHFEIVRTDGRGHDQSQPWHVRLIASNGAVMLTSENYSRRADALTAIAVAAEAFGVAMNRPPTQGEGSSRLLGMPGLTAGETYSFDVRDVDERTETPR